MPKFSSGLKLAHSPLYTAEVFCGHISAWYSLEVHHQLLFILYGKALSAFKPFITYEGYHTLEDH